MSDLVTVVIATHNRRRYLEEAIASVIAQEGVAFELIVVDDASTDDTGVFLEAFAHPLVRVIRLTTNGERSAARNRGLAEARGELIMFLDDDDRLRPGALAALAPPLLSDPEAVAAVGARWRFEGDRGTRIPHPSAPMKLRIEDDLLCGWSSVSGQNLYRAATVRAAGGYDTGMRVSEDRDLWLKVAARGPVLIRPQLVMDYRIHGAQTETTGVEGFRAIVYGRAVAALPPGKRRRARRIQKSGEDRWRANVLRRDGRLAAAFFYAVRSIVLRPSVVRSPLLSRVMHDVFWATIPQRVIRLLWPLRRSRRVRSGPTP